MMRTRLFYPVLAILSILLCAFSISPKMEEKPDIVIQITTEVGSDGSGEMKFEIIFSKEVLGVLKGLPGFPQDQICGQFNLNLQGGEEWIEQETDGALTCLATLPFADLDELEALTNDQFSGAHFDRLEIADGHFYYDLAANWTTAYDMGDLLPFGIEAWWIVKVPGDVVETNADKTSGRALTWNMLTMNQSSQLQAESKIGGGFLGIDPTLTVVGGVLLLGCCCVVLLIAAGAAFFFLRRKGNPPTEA
jgi:hypothetical protein